MKTKKKAISLIVLVVTIIVLAILAATVIVTITNSGIINRATDTVKEYDLSEVRSLANLAWAEALMDENVRTDAEYDAYVKQQLTNAGVNIGDYNIGATSSGVLVTLRGNQSETEYAGLTITADTEGFTFIPVDGVEVTDERIANLQAGDKVVYGDYVYCYGCEQSANISTENMYAWLETGIAGWGCSVIDESIDKTELGEMCGMILGEPVVSLKYAFGGWLDYGNYLVFNGMLNLTVAPTIPSSVIDMDSAFYGCPSLKEVPTIPSSVTSMNSTFRGCTGLIKAPIILAGVTSMDTTFKNCTSLKEVPTIPSSVTDMDSTFWNCTALTDVATIPSSVTSMDSTFWGCTSLKEVPTIPSSVTSMFSTFRGCTSLEGEVKIESSEVSNMSGCFNDITQALTVRVPANSTTYTTITSKYGSNSNITIETFESQTVTP